MDRDSGGRPRPGASIGLPVFNGEEYLEASLESLLGQTYEDFELVVADNASTDSSLEIARSYARRDERIRILTSPTNLGAAANYNRAFRASRGRYFRWAAADDLCDPSHVEQCVAALDDSLEAVLAYPRSRFIDSHGSFLRYDSDVLATTSRSPVRRAAHVVRRLNRANAVFGLMRADALARTRLIGPFVSSDFVLLVELALMGQIVEVPHVLFSRRLHEESSREANVEDGDVARWFAPGGSAVRSVRLNLLREYARSSRRLVASSPERWLTYAAIPTTYAYQRTRVWVGGVRRALAGSYRVAE